MPSLMAIGFLLITYSECHAQGFMVKPMRIELTARPGELLETVIELRNTTSQKQSLEFLPVELTQSQNGSWQIIDPASDVDTSGLSSCLDWLSFDARSMEVDAQNVWLATMQVQVPMRATGVYFAGLIAQSVPDPKATGIQLKIRFLIPVIVHIQGRPERQRVELAGVNMTYREATQTEPGTTLVGLNINNEGRTYSRVRGSVQVMTFSRERWWPVAQTDIDERGIIPGSKLYLATDIQRRLPSGKYRLTGTLYIDGRRMRPMELEIDFEGDPDVDTLAIDTALMLEPQEIAIQGTPGATRASVLTVKNASDEAVTIQAFADAPAALKGMAMGELRGDDLSCHEWLRVIPEKFTLRAGATQNVRIMARIPREELVHANYYGQLILKAAYPDGQSAGETGVLVSIDNTTVAAEPAAQAVHLRLAEEDDSKYVILSRFSNIGNTIITPKPSASLVTAREGDVSRAALTGDDSPMLPFAIRDFAGVMDFTNIEPGTYGLRASLEYAPGKVEAKQIPIEVTEEDGRKIVSVIGSEEE